MGRTPSVEKAGRRDLPLTIATVARVVVADLEEQQDLEGDVHPQRSDQTTLRDVLRLRRLLR